MSNRKRRSEIKRRRIEHLSVGLRRLDPSFDGDFKCPICLRSFQAVDEDGATEAHIVPQAAGGTLSTFLCRDCNSGAGSGIDKWFGEHLHLRRSKKTIIDSRIKTGRINLDGISLGGRIETGENGGLNVLLYKDRTDPKSWRAVDERIRGGGPKVLDIEFPLLGKSRDVNLGALQAAYLSFFKGFGYVPVLQRSFDIVRSQLLEPEKNLLGAQFIARTSEDLGYSIGVAEIDRNICLFASFFDLVVFLPPYGEINFYEQLPEDFKLSAVKLHPLRSKAQPKEGVPTALFVGNKTLLWPDYVPGLAGDILVAYLEEPSSEVQLMQTISKQDYDKLALEEGCESVKINIVPSD